MSSTKEVPVSPEVTTPPPRAMSSPVADEPPLTLIDGHVNWRWDDFVELWRFRELFYYLTLRDIKLRYKQTALGFGWSVFQPLATILVFVVFVGVLGNARGDMRTADYILFVIAGVIPWNFFASAVQNAGNSLVSNERLVTKMYFPRLALPTANVFAAFFDLTICLGLFAVTLIGFAIAGEKVALTWQILLAPLVVFFLVLFATGLGMFMSALIAAQRDFRFLISFGIQLWMFATPCIYLPPERIGEKEAFLQFNPVYGFVYNFRATTLGGEMNWTSLGISVFASLAMMVLAMVYFRRVERTIADTI